MVVKYVTMRYACMQEVATVIDVAAITAKHNIVAAKFAIPYHYGRLPLGHS